MRDRLALEAAVAHSPITAEDLERIVDWRLWPNRQAVPSHFQSKSLQDNPTNGNQHYKKQMAALIEGGHVSSGWLVRYCGFAASFATLLATTVRRVSAIHSLRATTRLLHWSQHRPSLIGAALFPQAVNTTPQIEQAPVSATSSRSSIDK